MRRREFIAGLGGAAAWPLAARAQQGERMRRVGYLGVGDDGPDVSALREELAKLGWAEGRNLRLEVRFGANDEDRIRAYAAELVGLAPDAIVSSGAAPTRAVQGQTRTIPIVIFGAGDIFTNGFVKDLAHPEGNTTGISNLFQSIGSKWVELLKEAVPQLKRVGYIYNAQLSTFQGLSPAINEASRVLAVQATAISFRDAVDLVHGIDAFAAEPNGGLITSSGVSLPYVKTINTLALQNRLPTCYGPRLSAVQGGLMSYGARVDELLRRAASLVDRILRGAKVSELPVEFPTKFELVVNLKTAKAIGLTIPEPLLVRADEVIE
jgi:putative tryptophan/tyrosine transport system substrate-binding protein